MTGEHNTDLQKSLGTLEAKYKSPAHGLTFVEKWNTDNVLKSEVTVEDTLLKGLKLALDTSYSPASGLVFFLFIYLNIWMKSFNWTIKFIINDIDGCLYTIKIQSA